MSAPATFIPYPNVPPYPGVPQLVRSPESAVAAVPVLAIGLGTLENILLSVLQQGDRWGIFTASGAQFGVTDNGKLTGKQIIAAIFTQPGPVLSTYSFDFAKETRISDFPLEKGSFASYNKVEQPANPVIVLSLDGSQSDRTHFLNLLTAATLSTDLFSVVTPEVTYVNYSIERFSYHRSAAQGAKLLTINVVLKEIRQVSASFTQVASPINAPQNAGATPPVNSGQVQAPTPPPSTLKSITTAIGSILK